MIKQTKKAAEESNMIIFIILALVVAGLVIWFSYSFFSTGASLIDGNDPSVQTAIESCKFEMGIDKTAYCNSEKLVKIRGGREMLVNCWYLNNNVSKDSMKDVLASQSISSDCSGFEVRQCKLMLASGTSGSDVNKTRVNGDTCKKILEGE